MDNRRAVILTVCALFTILSSSGCFEHTNFPELVVPAEKPAALVPAQYRIVGESVQNRPIMSLVLGQGPDAVFIMATIHGNEPAGTPLVRRLGRHLRQYPELLEGRTVVLLPVANPDGMAADSRSNANGVDLNRNFAAANRVDGKQGGEAAFSEPEARAIDQLIRQYWPDRIVSIHQVMDSNYGGLAKLVPIGCIDYDGPGAVLAGHMAQYCDLPVKKLGARPGSLGSYAGVTLGIPIITFEMLRTDSQLDSETLWQRYGKALLAAVVYPDKPPL